MQTATAAQGPSSLRRKYDARAVGEWPTASAAASDPAEKECAQASAEQGCGMPGGSEGLPESEGSEGDSAVAERGHGSAAAAGHTSSAELPGSGSRNACSDADGSSSGSGGEDVQQKPRVALDVRAGELLVLELQLLFPELKPSSLQRLLTFPITITAGPAVKGARAAKGAGGGPASSGWLAPTVCWLREWQEAQEAEVYEAEVQPAPAARLELPLPEAGESYVTNGERTVTDLSLPFLEFSLPFGLKRCTALTSGGHTAEVPTDAVRCDAGGAEEQ